MVPFLRVPVSDRVRPLISVFLLPLVLLYVPYYFDRPIDMAVIALICCSDAGDNTNPWYACEGCLL
jgi:hypothetical protein